MGILDAPGLSRREGRFKRGWLAARDLRHLANTPATTATIGATATTTAFPSGRLWPALSLNQSAPVAGVITRNTFAYSGGYNIQPFGTNYPNNGYVAPYDVNGQTVITPSYCVDFEHYGASFEIDFRAITGYFMRISVDGQLIGTVASSSTAQFVPVTYATPGAHRVRLEMSGAGFGGVRAAATDTVAKSNVAGPRVVVFGDSYSVGTGATVTGSAGSWVRTFANVLGLPDVANLSIGGTGWMNPGTAVKAFDRVNDVISAQPDYVLWTMGKNDAIYTQQQVYDQVVACFGAVKAALPNCQQAATSCLWGPGVSSLGAGAFGVRDAIKAACALFGFPFIDQIEIPLDAPGVVTSLSTAITVVGFGSVQTPNKVAIGSTIHIGAYPNGERRVVKNATGPASGNYTLTLEKNLNGTYPVGTAVTEVGASFFDGAGNTGAPTGWGNSDVFVGPDAVHPSQAGHNALGMFLAERFAQHVLA